MKKLTKDHWEDISIFLMLVFCGLSFIICIFLVDLYPNWLIENHFLELLLLNFILIGLLTFIPRIIYNFRYRNYKEPWKWLGDEY